MKNNNGSYSHILKYTSLFGGVQMLNILIGLIRNKLVAVLLGPLGMGIVALYTSTINFIVNTSNLGIHASAVKELSQAFETGDTGVLNHKIHVLRHWTCITSLLGMMAFACLSPLLSRWTFATYNYTIQFICLAPVVALTIIALGETAILKATRLLRQLAIVSVCGAVGVLAVSVPIYWIYGCDGIVASLVLMAVVEALTVTAYSLRRYPLSFAISKACVHEGRAFLGLGIAFVVSGIMGSGVEMAIRAYLSNAADIATVGLYNAVYAMVFTYAGIVFTAMDTDYFPRLSGISCNGNELNDAVNRQIGATMAIVSPLAVLFILCMPVLLPLLYSGKFAAALPMLQVAALSMYCRGVYLPIEYVALSRGDSKTFIVVEVFSGVLLVSFVVLGFETLGLKGMGIGITAAYFVEMFFAWAVCRMRYGYRMSGSIIKTTVMHMICGLCMYSITNVGNTLWYCLLGVMVFVIDAFLSISSIRENVGKLKR